MGRGSLETNFALLRSLIENHIRQTDFIARIRAGTCQREGAAPATTITEAELAETIIAYCSNRTNLSGTTYKRLRKHLNNKAALVGKKKKKKKDTISSPETFLRPRISTDPNQVTVAVRILTKEIAIQHFDWFEHTTFTAENEPIVRSHHSCVATTVMRPEDFRTPQSTVLINKQKLPFEEFVKAVHAKVKAFCPSPEHKFQFSDRGLSSRA